MRTVMLLGKSPAKHRLAAGASFKRVISVTRNGSHLVKNLKGPTNMKSHPLIMTTPLKEVYK